MPIEVLPGITAILAEIVLIDRAISSDNEITLAALVPADGSNSCKVTTGPTLAPRELP